MLPVYGPDLVGVDVISLFPYGLHLHHKTILTVAWITGLEKIEARTADTPGKRRWVLWFVCRMECSYLLTCYVLQMFVRTLENWLGKLKGRWENLVSENVYYGFMQARNLDVKVISWLEYKISRIYWKYKEHFVQVKVGQN